MRLLVTGGGGQLAQEIAAEAKNSIFREWLLADRSTMDIAATQRELLHKLEKLAPTHIINAAAYTAVDRAEEEPYEAMMANAIGVRNLGVVARRLGMSLVHVSTDFIFDGLQKTPYQIDDSPNPLGVYGRTKLYGELALRQHNPDATVVRTSWLYSARGRNFTNTMLRLGREREEISVVADQIGCPTYAKDLARCLLHLCKADVSGRVLHFSNEGQTSWHGFASAIMELAGLSCRVIPITTAEYPTPATRPPYSVLDKGQTQALLPYPIPHWKDSLRECLDLVKSGA